MLVYIMCLISTVNPLLHIEKANSKETLLRQSVSRSKDEMELELTLGRPGSGIPFPFSSSFLDLP